MELLAITLVSEHTDTGCQLAPSSIDRQLDTLTEL